MKTENKFFDINENYRIKCTYEDTRYGFRHLASLVYLPKYMEVEKTKQCYYNRTWESFEFENVISKLLQKSDCFTEEQKKQFMDSLRKKEHEEVNSMFKCIGMVAKMGELLTDSQKDANDWKARMIKAGLEGQGLIMPDNWGQLSEDEKQKRLDGIINHLI